VDITIKNKIWISNPPERLRSLLIDKLTIPNPKFLENQKMGRWNGKTPPTLKFWKDTPRGLVIPRGFCRQLIFMCRKHDVSHRMVDHRGIPPSVDFTFSGTLKPFQKEAVASMIERDFGTLSAPTGSGKTVMALYIIAQRRQPALIIVHTKELLHQWIDRISSFIGIPKDEIGIIGDGKKIIGEKVTVSLIQSLFKCADEVAPHIGHLIVDECHRTPSRTFTEAVTTFDSKYMLGLSATPWRRDKLSKLIFWHIGDVQHQVDTESLVESGDILKADVIIRETDFRPFHDASEEYSKMLSELTEDTERNSLIASDVAEQAKNGGGVCIVLSDRKSHCDAIKTILSDDHGLTADVLTGDVSNTKRQEMVERLNSGGIKVLIATGQLIGEGFDCKNLSTLFLATPVKFDGRVLQYLGRVLRPAPGKKTATVYDYMDIHVGPLVASAKSRQRVYGRR